MHGDRGFAAFIMMLLIGAAALYLFIYGLPSAGPEMKSPLEMQMDALNKTKTVEQLSEERTKRIEQELGD